MELERDLIIIIIIIIIKKEGGNLVETHHCRPAGVGVAVRVVLTKRVSGVSGRAGHLAERVARVVGGAEGGAANGAVISGGGAEAAERGAFEL
jgi:hypothetical protein